MRNQFILFNFLLALSTNVSAEQENIASLFSYELGVHLNHFNDDGYFNFKSTETVGYENLGVGYNLSVNYHIGEQFSDKAIFTPIFFSAGWTHFDKYKSSLNHPCNKPQCKKSTSIEHDALMLNVHYSLPRNSIADIDFYVGLSQVFASGQLNGDSWDDTAIGTQIGANFTFIQDSTFEPFIGFRLLSFEIEQGSHLAKTIDTSFLIGIRF